MYFFNNAMIQLLKLKLLTFIMSNSSIGSTWGNFELRRMNLER